MQIAVDRNWKFIDKDGGSAITIRGKLPLYVGGTEKSIFEGPCRFGGGKQCQC